MKIIPVMDILNGIVVHAIRGQRKEYKPLQSTLTSSVQPLAIAKAFKDLGFKQLYVADLDAIINCSSSFDTLKQVHDETGLELIVDAGITSIERAQKLADAAASKVVVGTETLQNKNFVLEAIKSFGSDRIVVSLDLIGKQVLTKIGFTDCLNPLCLLKEFEAMGVSNVIVLDLARVGSGAGVDLDFLRKAKAETKIEIYVGGGVRDLADIVELNRLDISGILVATALHTGKITVEDLKREKFL